VSDALNVSEGELQKVFEVFGNVTSAKIIKDKYSGESKGFGFVEMPVGAEAQSAINGLNEKELKGQALKVNEARPPRNRKRGGGSGGYQRY
jgi:RNA recognition motif-containing protein